MNTWTPIFSKIVDSSLWVEPDHVCKVFVTMLALKDADQVVRYNAFGLARRCWPMDLEGGERKVMEALEILSNPDKRRLEEQAHDGRRIRRVEDGWLILNGEVYEAMMRGINRKVYKAAKEREARADGRRGGRKRSRPLAGELRAVAAVNEGNEELADKIAAGEA